ncbi:NUDIX hydrolase [Thiomonas sp.]|uniref:NUDIX hydrolase n=1 Tax=Thiomonas sp. TaxID=2047785 RepID=UPI00261F302E|nr:NUDIX hydrolase [Thiomonas sp.]
MSADSALRPRVTVAAIIEHQGRFLLVEEQTPDGLRLNQPAGHLEAGESPLQGVVREALEETACEFTPAGLLGVYLSRTRRPAGQADADVSYLRLAFYGTAGAPQPQRRLDSGIVRTVWMTPQEVRASADRHRSPLVLRCIDDYLRGRRFPLDVVCTDAGVFCGDAAPGVCQP